MLRAIAVYCCAAFFFFFTVFVQIYFCKYSWLLFWKMSQVAGWELIFLVSSSKEGRAPFWTGEEGEKCDFLNGHVLPWISWIWEGSRNCEMGISWKGETLRNCFFCFYNLVLRENFPFKAVVLLKMWMRYLPVTAWDALEGNVCRSGSGESGDCLTTCLIQGDQVLPWVAFFQRPFNDSGAQAPLISSLVQNAAAGAWFSSSSHYPK